MASQVVNLKAAGLQTYYQSLMEISPGALLKADNTVINRSGVIEPRRGFKAYGPSFGVASDRAKQLFQYRNTLIRHVGNKLAFDDGAGNFTDFLGTYLEPISGYRIKTVEAKSNIYFTTNESVKKISVKTNADIKTSSIEDAGVPKAFSGTGFAVYDQSGFLPAKGTTVDSNKKLTKDYFVAYRVLWSTTDANSNLLLGSPSDRILVSNVARLPEASAKITFPVPDGITTSYKYRIYRSEVAESTTPSDEMNLVFEAAPTAAQITAKSVSYIDRILEDVRLGGVPLYTNQYSGEGILKANEIPPSALDVALFNGHLFYANTKLKEFVEIELKKVKNGAISISSGVSNLIFTDGTQTSTYLFEGAREKYSLQFRAVTALDPRYSYIELYSVNDERKYRLEILNTSNPAGSVIPVTPSDNLVEVGTISIDSTFTATQIANSVRSKFYTYSSCVFDFDMYVSGTFLYILNNNNGRCTDATLSYSASPNWIIYSKTTEGLGENLSTNKILISNGFNPTASTDNVSWSAGGTTITCPGGTSGFFVGRRVQAGDSIPSNAIITQVNAGNIVIDLPIPAASSGRMLVQLSDTDLSIEQTCKSIVRVVNNDSSSTINGYYLSTSGESPGKMLFERRNFSQDTFYIGTADLNIVSFFTPEINKTFANSSIALTNPTTITTSSNHGLSVDSQVVIYGATSTESINGVQKVTALGVTPTTQYKINKNVTVATVNGYTMVATLKSSDEATTNRIYYSKYQQPEAVPILFYVDVGSKDYEISRILSSKDSLFILKKDGIFRLSGEGGSDPVWSVSAFDNTVKIIAPDSATILANDCYFLSNQGYIKVTESNLMYLSTSIEDKILPFINTSTSIASSSFSIAYESDRSLLAWTILSKNDTYATVCYRFNVFTQTWTEWRIPKTCGVLNPFQDKLYLGSAVDNYVEVERKNFNRYDYADREIDLVLSSLSLNGTILKIGSYELASEGDVIAQTQYLSIYQFNSFLKKLDLDNGLLQHDFYEDYKLSPGESLTAKMSLVVARLNLADPTTNYSLLWTSPTDFATIQTQFNTIVTALNNSVQAIFSNYKTSTGTVTHEIVVESIDFLQKHLDLSAVPYFIVGPVRLYKAIKTEIQYAPQHAGDVSGFKQFSTGTFLFERRSFRSARISYNSDISDSYEDVTFYLDNSGTYGTFDWGEGSIWGGQGDQAQVRTYIPLKKQKCRFLGCKFYHNTAFENYQLYGISMSVRLFTISDRDYK